MLSISIGSLSLPVDRLLLLLSFALAMLVSYIVGRKNKCSADGKIAMIFIAAMLIARAVFVIEYWTEYRQDWWSIIDIRDAGFNAWVGITAMVVLTALVYWKNSKIRRSLLSGAIAGMLLWGLVTFGLWIIKDTSQKLPKIVVSQLSSDDIELSQIATDKPRVINLWATWCPPCRREMPVLQQAQRQNSDVGFIFVNQGEHPAVIEQFLEQEALQLNNVVADDKAMLGQLIGSRALPTTLFVNEQGELIDAHLGELSRASLAAKLERLKQPQADKYEVND
ncbi:TlpA family protein disulfide reductase [Kangiella sp. HD9-110m-PIT-SAG07]|nr:TlpA family protein disulfide reductase [Kangiella sp. HD9-110m-PIT-SAG07]